MGQSYFIWKGIDCRAMDVIMTGPAPVIRPEERVQHIEVPGRSGDMTELEGTDIYNSYIQTVSIAVHMQYNIRNVYKWLRGSGYVTFSTDPERRQKARIIGAITLNKRSKNSEWYEGEVQFYCQPLKEKLCDEKQTVTSSGTTIKNDGDITAKPEYKVTTSATTVTLTVNGKTLTIDMTGLSNQAIYVDCETLEVVDAPRTGWMTWRTSGNWPVLPVGSYALTGSGWSSIEVTKRERFL